MGPRPFSRGNGPYRLVADLICPGFNGATAFQPWKCSLRARRGTQKQRLQWGHGLSAVEMLAIHAWGGRNCGWLQWGHGLSAVEISDACQSFRLLRRPLQWGHGLSAVEIASGLRRCDAAMPASMGPRPFSRGNARTRRPAQSTRACFNGATAFQPWKSERERGGRIGVASLQWGHGLSAVEIVRSSVFQFPDRSLQWGHGLSAVEISPAVGSSPSPPPLQWGHGLSAVEM